MKCRLFVRFLVLFSFSSNQVPLLAFDSFAAVPFILGVLYLKVPLQQNRLMKEEQEQNVCFVFAIFYSTLRCERLYSAQDFRRLTRAKTRKKREEKKREKQREAAATACCDADLCAEGRQICKYALLTTMSGRFSGIVIQLNLSPVRASRSR